jgi:hypothetical protein
VSICVLGVTAVARAYRLPGNTCELANSIDVKARGMGRGANNTYTLQLGICKFEDLYVRIYIFVGIYWKVYVSWCNDSCTRLPIARKQVRIRK